MTSFQQLVARRRSCRKYKSADIEAAHVQLILRAALMAPTSRNLRQWQFVVVDDGTDLQKLADAKERGAAFVKDAAMAVVVLGDPTADDCWVEDGSIAAISMQYQAEALGIGSCWVQVRGRRLSDGTPSAEVVRGILDIPQQMEVLCIVAFGLPDATLPTHEEEDLKWENVHIDKFQPHDQL